MDILQINSKKGSLSLEVVIVAALALLVLVVVTVIFAGRMGIWNRGLNHCDTECKQSSQECIDAGYDIPTYVNGCQDNSGSKYDGDAYCCKGRTS